VAFGGISAPAPYSPYAYSGAHVSNAFSPITIEATPISHPLMT